MKHTKLVLALLVAAIPAGTQAAPVLHVNPNLKECSVQFAPELTQGAFHDFVREFGSVSAYKPMAPPAPLGRGGIELGIQQMYFTVDDAAPKWNDTFYHPEADHWLGSQQTFPKLGLRVGVSDRVDVGGYFTKNPDANYGWLGFDVRGAVMRQGTKQPVDLMVRGAYTKTLYVDDMDMNTFTADASVGRTFWNLVQPYVGVGGDIVTASERSDMVALHSETVFVQHAFAGVGLRYWHAALGIEGEVGALNRLEVHVAAVR